jgi:hypothetical protein
LPYIPFDHYLPSENLTIRGGGSQQETAVAAPKEETFHFIFWQVPSPSRTQLLGRLLISQVLVMSPSQVS